MAPNDEQPVQAEGDAAAGNAVAAETPAPIEQPNSPEQGESLPTPQPAAATVEPAIPPADVAPITPLADAPPDQGRFPVREEVAAIPPVSPPAVLPGTVFSPNGQPSQGQPIPPDEQKRVYVQADGTKVDCKVVARRPNGLFDIVMPWGTTEIRRDGVQKRQDESQTGDYLE